MKLYERGKRNIGAGMVALLFLAPLVGWGDADQNHPLRAMIMWAGTAGLAALLAARIRWTSGNWLRPLREVPGLFAITLVAWAASSFLLTTPESGRARGIALAEVLRLACGVALYLGVRHGFPTRRRLAALWLVILIGGIIVATAGIISAAAFGQIKAATAAYGDKQLLAAFLVGLLPFAVVTVPAGPTRTHRALAWPAVILVSTALIFSANRTSWLAGIGGLLLAGGLGIGTWAASRRVRASARRPGAGNAPTGSTAKIALASLAAIAIVAAIIFWLGTIDLLRGRLATGTLATTLSSRMTYWRAAIHMVRDRPLLGWGVGSFPWQGPPYYAAEPGPLREMPTSNYVLAHGTSIATMVHNEYLQLAVELGLVGAGLYLATLAGFFLKCATAWIRLPPGTMRRSLLAACLCAVAAQCLDAIGNPGWHFGDVGPLLWLMMGLGMAATRRRHPNRPAQDR